MCGVQAPDLGYQFWKSKKALRWNQAGTWTVASVRGTRGRRPADEGCWRTKCAYLFSTLFAGNVQLAHCGAAPTNSLVEGLGHQDCHACERLLEVITPFVELSRMDPYGRRSLPRINSSVRKVILDPVSFITGGLLSGILRSGAFICQGLFTVLLCSTRD